MKNNVHSRRRLRGFTLIEIMIAVAIIGIIVAIALPSYTSYVQRARRADARTQLLIAAQFMQRFYAANDQYAKTRDGVDALVAMPDALKRSPVDGTQLYGLSFVTPPSASTFKLQMVPVAGTSAASDKCGTFFIDQSGVKDISGDPAYRAECWK